MTMRFSLLNRKVHYWLSAIIAAPLLVMVCSGLLLQVKKQLDWVQPPEQRGTSKEPGVDFATILGSLRGRDDITVEAWSDIDRIDVRPKKGLVKVTLQDDHEVQLDLGTGAVLQVAIRRSDLIESLHDGSFFAGDIGKLAVFLPTGIGLLVLWATGLWLFWLPFSVRRRRRRLGGPQAS